MSGDSSGAAPLLSLAVELNPGFALGWHALGDQLAILGDRAGAEYAFARPLPGSLSDPALIEPARRLFDGREEAAWPVLRDRFNLHPVDAAAAKLLADIGLRLGFNEAVERFLAPWATETPPYPPLRYAYVIALQRQLKIAEALSAAERLPQDEPGSIFSSLQIALLMQAGDYDQALTLCEAMLKRVSDQPTIWIGYGHVLKIVGRRAQSVAAYRKALAMAPQLGQAYWGLANLKVAAFAPVEVEAMRRLLDQPDLSRDDRIPLHFSLGKALEDLRDFEASFHHYREGNALRRALTSHDAEAHSTYVERLMGTLTSDWFAARKLAGDPSPDPIFIVGLPRSGSTLLEQMLCRHSAIEAAGELPYLPAIAARFDPRHAGGRDVYPTSLRDVDLAQFTSAGKAYLERVRLHRRLGRAHIIDKLPGNVMHIGLIQLMLPNAKIIDLRRHPMACCFSIFKQLFGAGHDYSYDLSDLGRYYADYVSLTRRVDAVLPGRVHHVHYERLVREPEAELRTLFAYCNLEFEHACLEFYLSSRSVATPSSEQVRRPLSSEATDHWRHYAPWLGDLERALGPLSHEN